MIMIDETYGVYTDEHNFILIKKPRWDNKKKSYRGDKSYFPTLILLFKHLLNIKARDSIGRAEKSSRIESIEALIDKRAKDLEDYFKTIVNKS